MILKKSMLNIYLYNSKFNYLWSLINNKIERCVQMVKIALIWENMYREIANDRPIRAGFSVLKKWQIGEKVLSGQVYNEKTLKNGNIQKRIVTVFPNGHLGFETKVNNPDGELLKAYVGVRTSSCLKNKPSAQSEIVNTMQLDDSAKMMYQNEGLSDPITLANVVISKVV